MYLFIVTWSSRNKTQVCKSCCKSGYSRKYKATTQYDVYWQKIPSTSHIIPKVNRQKVAGKNWKKVKEKMYAKPQNSVWRNLQARWKIEKKAPDHFIIIRFRTMVLPLIISIYELNFCLILNLASSCATSGQSRVAICLLPFCTA